ncbi:hypothetical protein [Pseudomonas sp. H9]|uniref:hypothetical protein n=1 Tax=Pseudomonas sp. H9 TaxID=483968 RepID=UPI001057964F|nr:hypothetical protein [Pseudomonas sp. H9]TDF83317.1 hypothetical protein E1573_11520 [Pseudomonas sp. H9]
MESTHKKALKAALDAMKTGRQKKSANDYFTALIDGTPFEAQEVRGFTSFGVNIVVGVIQTAKGRKYISFAADDDLAVGDHPVTLDGKVTVGYMIEEGENLEYPADKGTARLKKLSQPYTGEFEVELEKGSPVSKITKAKFSVAQMTIG